MKFNKKMKPNLSQAFQKQISKPQAFRTSDVISNSQHRKLLQYRDYLLSLRKMDLGTLISQNRQRKNFPSKCKDIPNDPGQYQQSSSTKQQSIKFEGKLETLNLETDNPQNMKSSQKMKQITSKNSNLQIFLEVESSCSKVGIKQVDKPKLNSFQLNLKNGLEEDDLYCHEDIQELMKSHQPQTPRLIHIDNSMRNSANRYHSTHHSSKCRDLSMPSIQQKNISQESESSIQNNPKASPKSISGWITERKYSSCNNPKPENKKKQENSKFKYQYKQNQFSLFSLTSPGQSTQKKGKKTQKENLRSTEDINIHSGERFQKLRDKNNVDIEINPFNLRSDLGPEKKSKMQKFYLNVGEIIKRISNRESKSSMSDRSYHQKQKNSEKHDSLQRNGRINSQDIKDKLYDDLIRQKFCSFMHQQPKALSIKNRPPSNQLVRRKVFKTQFK